MIWDGVTNYLQPEAVDAITRWVSDLARGGQFIFTYIHSGVLDGSKSFEGAAAILERFGERVNRGPSDCVRIAVAYYLEQHGLHLLAEFSRLMNTDAKVMRPDARRMRGYGFYHAVLAEIRGANPSDQREIRPD